MSDAAGLVGPPRNLLCWSGADRDRTDDIQLAKLSLSQLSYSPREKWWAWMDSNHRPYAYQAYALTT